jgi:hypothetical protein
MKKMTPDELLEYYNKRLDFEAEADRAKILFSDQVGVDCAKVFGGKPPRDQRAFSQRG